MGIAAHRSIDKLHLASALLKFFNEQHLVDVVAGKSIRSGDDDLLKSRSPDLLSQPIQTWPTEFGSTVTVIAQDVFFVPGPFLGLMILL